MAPSPPESIRETPHLIRLSGNPEVYSLLDHPEKLLLVLHGELLRTWISAGSILYAFSADPPGYVQLAEYLRSAIASEMPVLSQSELESRFRIVRPLRAAHFAQVGHDQHYRPNCLILEAHPHEGNSFFENHHAFASSHDGLEKLVERILQENRQTEDRL